MRVAWLLGTWPSPTETFLAREMDALARQGIELLPFAFRPGPDGPAPGVRYRPAAGPACPRLPRRVAGVLVRGLLRKPSLGLRWLRNLPFAVWLRDRLREERCDLLHAAWCGLPAMTAWLCRQLGGPPYTVAGHAYDVFTAPEAADEALLEAEGVTVCNRAAEHALAARLPALRPRLAYNPHGIPLADWPRRTAEPVGAAVILGVGRLVEKKGFDQLVNVIPFLPRAGRPYVLRILGEGPERGKLEALARERGVNLELPGHVSEGGVRTSLEQATALVLPSRVDRRGDRDGVANVLLRGHAGSDHHGQQRGGRGHGRPNRPAHSARLQFAGYRPDEAARRRRPARAPGRRRTETSGTGL
ncbi:MAG: glycosyltransferase family 4 protein [Armatimonadetes bacterium]|nr:glycosyltransferase family 4 protein [Armatimonadota bacterium]